MVELIDSTNAFRPLVASKQPTYPISFSDGLTFCKQFFIKVFRIKYKKNNTYGTLSTRFKKKIQNYLCSYLA